MRLNLGLTVPAIAFSLFSLSIAPLRAQEQTPTLAPDFVASDAQIVPKPAGPPPTPEHTGIKALARGLWGDVKALPSRENLFWVAVGGGLALAAHPADKSVTRSLSGNRVVENVFKPGEIMGAGPTLFGAAATIYAFGLVKEKPKVSHLGMDLLRSLAIAEGLTQVVKYSARRQRPDLSGRNSFPSGHAADTFAFATTLERHFGWRGAVPAYIVSSYIAASRLPANRHFLSDVIFGSAIGIIAGRTVTEHGRKYAIRVDYVPAGAMVSVTPNWRWLHPDADR